MKSPLRPPVSTGHLADTVHAYGEDAEHVDLRTYWLMVVERKWYAISVFLATVLIAVAYTFLTTPLYEGVATVEVLKHGPQVLRVADVVETTVTSDADLNTQIKILESVAMIQNVISRLSSDELRQLTEPCRTRFGSPRDPVSIIFENRKVLPQRMSLIVAIRFRHPNAKIAARVANLFATEYIAYYARVRVEESLKAVDELKDRADQQRKRVDEIANALQAFRQRGNLISLVQTKDIVTEKLKALNLMATQTSAELHEAEIRWNQVQEWSKAGRDLSELPFIASQAKVNQLILQTTTQKLTIAQLRERYKDKHPRLIEALDTLAQAEREMKAALAQAASSVRSEYENALQKNEAARRALAEQEAKSLELDKSAVEYDNLDRDFRVNDQLLESMMARMREASVTSSIESENARIIDRAVEPAVPVSPNIFINLLIGVLAGIFLGLGFAYFIATIDDKVKTAFDVETLIGLPLVGVIPRIERMDQPDKAQVVGNGADLVTLEAFRSLYSTLRINDESRNAKFILVTSTLPGEGKSFVATNLALTFASQGQRTVIVDCDLRKPNVQRSFRLRTSRGILSYCAAGAPLDDIVTRNVHPNLDAIATGGRAKDPIQVLNSREFEALVAELGKSYDRVIFDTPPLGAVSDALNMLPLMDGAIYTIQFNRVTRLAAQRCARRLLSANVPVFGAVLNDVYGRLVSGLYGEYGDKAYREYLDGGMEGATAPSRG